ncbi:hypothetical protein [Alicyclobacillus dauci]|uniref:Uncharacterized protein n=1 Tax=Alicyclobacillus dauci TaxID=1475485 RepID=A0ABY6Z055_9BACL|nr:hypothetical protein [Alicyclobacillus dauci]WAH36097.1 hypothetical protein NZD86_17870 [Alicyclobacillus dauci]
MFHIDHAGGHWCDYEDIGMWKIAGLMSTMFAAPPDVSLYQTAWKS